MELLPVGNTTLASADFVVVAGQMPTIFLKDVTGSPPGDDENYGVGANAHVYLQIKSGTQYFTVATLDAGGSDDRGTTHGAAVIAGPGTFRVLRPAGSVSVGVDKEG